MKQIHREEREHEEEETLHVPNDFVVSIWVILAFFLLFLAVDVDRFLGIATTLKNTDQNIKSLTQEYDC